MEKYSDIPTLDSDKSFVRIVDVDSNAKIEGLSKSGKAINLPCPKGQQSFWCPLSLVRLKQQSGFHPEIVIPMWFCLKNNIEF